MTLGSDYNSVLGKKISNFFFFRNALVTLDGILEGAHDDLALADAPALRRQVRTRSVNTDVGLEAGLEVGLEYWTDVF